MEVSSPDYSQRTAKEWFNLEDVNQDGYVSKDELLKIALNVGMNMEEAEQTVLGYYMRADENGDGKLEWNGICISTINKIFRAHNRIMFYSR